jgi:hypothetical protein
MSNIREVEGVFINLDLVKYIEIYEKESFKIKFIFNFVYQNVFCHENQRVNDSRFEEIVYGKIKYKTREEAECKVREIIEHQNNQYRKTK